MSKGDNQLRLGWPGRVWVPGGAPAASRGSWEQLETSGDAAHRLLLGDVLAVTDQLRDLEGKVDLVYVDPPFASERDYVAEARLDGGIDGRVVRTKAYDDTWGSNRIGDYLDMIAPRLDALTRLLKPRGTIWVHLDWRAAYLVRAILDEIFGREGFVNEIVWRRAPNLGRQAASGQFGRTLDTLVVYGKRGATLKPPTRLEPIEPSTIKWDDEGRPFTSAPRGDYTDLSIAKLEKEGRVHRSKAGKVYIKYFLVKDASGTWCRERRVDALWTDVPPLRHASPTERTGYPTQKPRALLERIVACASEPGGIVVDAFCGSGTTGVAAHALGRRAILGDRSPVAIANARARMLRERAGLSIERVGDHRLPEAELRVKATKGRVALVAPTEPLAWAVGRMKGGTFHCTWWSERTPGTKTVHVVREAPFDPSREGWVRVWGDDGTMTTRPIVPGRAQAKNVVEVAP